MIIKILTIDCVIMIMFKSSDCWWGNILTYIGSQSVVRCSLVNGRYEKSYKISAPLQYES